MVQAKNTRTMVLLLVMLVAAVLPVCVAWGSYYCQQPCKAPASTAVPYNTVASAHQAGELPGFPSLLLCN